MCLQTVLEFVDGDQRSDSNTFKVIEAKFVHIAASILNLNFFNIPTSNQPVGENEIYRVVKHNFKSIKTCSDEVSWIQNIYYVIAWLKTEYNQETTSPELRSQEFAMIPHDGTQVVNANFRMSLLKMKTLECLIELTNSGDLITQNAFMNFYSDLDPMIIRKNYTFQTEMFRYHHKEKYRSYLLNMSQVDPDQKTESGFVIEIGYLLFTLLVKIDEFQQTGRKDHRYGKQLMRLLPEEVRNDVPTSQAVIFQISEFVVDIYKRLKRI